MTTSRLDVWGACFSTVSLLSMFPKLSRVTPRHIMSRDTPSLTFVSLDSQRGIGFGKIIRIVCREAEVWLNCRILSPSRVTGLGPSPGDIIITIIMSQYSASSHCSMFVQDLLISFSCHGFVSLNNITRPLP